jgi:hypothetical protein
MMQLMFGGETGVLKLVGLQGCQNRPQPMVFLLGAVKGSAVGALGVRAQGNPGVPLGRRP